MRCKTILVALLALAFQAQATHVSQSDAASAARVWAGAGSALGIRLGANVESVQEHAVTNGYSFYAVKLDGGTVIMTSDTDLEPVVAFSSNGDFDLSEGSRALDLLRKDVAFRAALTGAFAGGGSAASSRRTLAASGASASATVPRPGASLWATLLSAGQQASSSPSRRLLAASSARPVSSISDVRVAPLVQSKWSQLTVDDTKTGVPCYNYYTPNNYVCGCTATAMSQIMRYFKFPVDEVEQREYDCVVGGTAAKLKMQGGIYDWENMVLVPKDGITEDGCKAIGKLTSDVGIALKSDYSGSVTGALVEDGAAAFRDAFGYADAVCYWNELGWDTGEGGLHERNLRTRVILANLDAGQPVQFAIYGYQAGHIGDSRYWAGHSVVADGYGYRTIGGVETEYVHINMGWSGKDDMWYNIPEINAANSGAHIGDSGQDYLYIGGAVFNISPGDPGLSILSGRIVDDDGAGVPGAAVKVFDEDGNRAGETVSDESGIYFFKLPGDKSYSLEAASADGKCVASIAAVSLPATKGLSDAYCVYRENNVGNSWGNDMVLALPSVRVGTRVFASLDRAIAAARDVATPVVEIIYATRLKASATIDFDCAIVATNPAAAASPVELGSEAQLYVADGGTLLLSNVVFSAASSTVVDVAEGGRLSLVGTVDFGVPPGTAAVRTADADGFCLLGGVEPGFTLDCAAATGAGEVFGYGYATSLAPFEAMRECAVRIANYNDPDGEERGILQQGSGYSYPLAWRQQVVPFEDCTGYFVDAAGVTNTAGSVDRLLDMYAEALKDGSLGDLRRVVVRKGGTLSRPLTVADGLTIVGEGVAIELEPTAGFTVTGGELSVSGISFANYVGNALFLVKGDDASLALGPGVALSDIEGTNRWSGAVTVLKGFASAKGATFANCRATGQYAPMSTCNSNGGAFYLAEGTSLELEDVSITGCSAKNLGGAVYAAKNAEISLAGGMNISGNTVPNMNDDVYLANVAGSRAELTLVGEVSGSVGVRLSGPADGYGNTVGLLFADAESAAVADASARAFFSDVNTDVVAAADGSALRWIEAPKSPQPWEGDPDMASARVEYADGTTNYYLLVTQALAAVKGDATIYVTGWNGIEIASDITISHKVTLASDLGLGLFWLYRGGDCSIKVVGKGASLTLRDISVYGIPMDEFGDPVYDGDFILGVSKPLFDVCGGSLTLASPLDDPQYSTQIAYVFSGGVDYNEKTGSAYFRGARNAGAVSVGKGGSFRMESRACIHDCANLYYNESDGAGRGGAVMVDEGEAVFEGGTIYNCAATSGGGVFVGSKGTISVSGDTDISDNNYSIYYDEYLDPCYGDENNLVVHDLGKLTLAGKLTGRIGYTEGIAGDKVVFGKVAAGVSETDAQSSAHRFTHDVTGDVGMAVSGADGMLLVWSDGTDENGVYTDGKGNEYELVPGETVKVAVPEAVPALVYSGEAQCGVEPGIGYTIVGNVATNAGDYVATATLKAGFEWDDGSTSANQVEWSIAKATYDMSGVSFDDRTVYYTGQYYELVASGVPDVLTVSYTTNNRQREVGVYTVTASFSGDADNYNAIDDMTATLTILAEEEPTPPEPGPGPTPGPDPAQPLPVVFSAISEAGGEWTLSVTTAVEKCWYSLYATNSLSEGFGIEGVEPVELRQARAADVPTMIFTQPSDGSALFWKVVAEPEDAH